MLEKFRKRIEMSRDNALGPRVVEFENGVRLVSELTGEEPKITFEKDGRVLLDLKTLAPEGTILKFDLTKKWTVEFFAGPDGKEKPHIFMGEFTGAEGILSFFHEIGHLCDRKIGTRAHEARKRREAIAERDGSQYSRERLLIIKADREAYTKAEMNAWDYALGKIFKLQAQLGIDILKKIGGIDGALRFINKKFQSYEQGALDELYHADIYSREQMDGLFAELEREEKREQSGLED